MFILASFYVTTVSLKNNVAERVKKRAMRGDLRVKRRKKQERGGGSKAPLRNWILKVKRKKL